MAIKVYCLALQGGDMEDVSVTLSLTKALEWLENNRRIGSVVEYIANESDITELWDGVWYYDMNDTLQHDTTENVVS